MHTIRSHDNLTIKEDFRATEIKNVWPPFKTGIWIKTGEFMIHIQADKLLHLSYLSIASTIM